MNKPPQTPKDPKKNLHFFIKDISNNNPFLDPCGNIFKNPLFTPLQPWNNHKKTLCLKDKDTKCNNIKNTNTSFTMRLESIIESIRNDRKYNSQNIKTNSLLRLTDTLKKNQNEKPNKKINFNDTLNTKDALDDLLLQITKKYDLVNYSPSDTTKKNPPHIKPPPLPPPGFPKLNHRRSTSIYIPRGNSWNTPLPPKPPEIKKELKIIDREINGISDLLELIKENPISPYIEYNINMKSIHNIKEPLFELDNMIGMNNLKDSIVDQIIYFVQNLHINKDAIINRNF